MTALLRAEALTFRADGGPLVEDASLVLQPGRLTIVIGPNGAGKSTLLRLLTGDLKASSGSIWLDGRAYEDWRPWQLACLRAVLPQQVWVSLPFSVGDVATLGLDGIGRAMPRAARIAIVDRALLTADVMHLKARPYHTLSGGEQQRVHFARVLCQLEAGRSVEPRQLLFLDEPIANLDLSHQLALLDATAALAQHDRSVLAVVHDLNLAAAYADDLLVMDKGRIVARGSPAEVLTDDLVATVFRVDLPVRATPPPPTPFLLPRRKVTDSATRPSHGQSDQPG